MPKEIIKPDKVFDTFSRGFYSHAIRVGNTIYCAGQVGRDREGMTVGKGDAGAQAAQAFENLKAVLEAAGASLSDVVKTTTYIVNRDDHAKVREARRRYFGDALPPSTLIIVAGLAYPEILVEIDATAVVES
ncbi:MAG: RidA family protein [Chloroflexi bacterium]|nr:RidA family protein [Chloroflexota bacterium]